MKLPRLRHPVRATREPFGKAGVAIGVVALVFAMLGGAYAATGGGGGKQTATASKNKKKKSNSGLNGKQKKEVKKISQTEAKKFATAGPAGAQGPAGANGKDGAAGNAGPQGAPGNVGAQGPAGPVGPAGPQGPEGEEGDEGAPGAAGSPWVAGEAPSGVVMKGTWSLPPFDAAAAGEKLFASVSTGVPVSQDAVVFPVVAPESFSGCTGTAEDPTPGSLPGILCIYPAESENLEEIIENAPLGESGGGVLLEFTTEGAGVAKGHGSWAMLAP